jgi:glycerol-3-phosphate dehydrogenase subunit B
MKEHIEQMSDSEIIETDVCIIGAGMAGMAAALFAANRRVSVVQVGRIGGMTFASGLLDLMGVHPVAENKIWQDPWAAIDALVADEPEHPYARLNKNDIRLAFDELLEFLDEAGLSYFRNPQRNRAVLTPVGTVKHTYAVPETMWAGARALEDKIKCLLIDFEGMKDYSARQIAETLKGVWPGLRAVRIAFPETAQGHEVFTVRMAQALELVQNRKKLAQSVHPHVKDALAVGMPAVLGLRRTRRILADLKAEIGVPVFEIPTMPVSVPGQRLKEAFETGLPSKGIQHFLQQEVLAAKSLAGGGFQLSIGNQEITRHIRTRAAILASGRFLGQGLYARRQDIRESIFDLPVWQPAARSEWHRQDLLDPRGHAVNRAGLEIDDAFHPVDIAGRPVFDDLYAAGTILAHQDWMRMKCGSGLAIATAYGAVKALLREN